jgi:hypothetical protein
MSGTSKCDECNEDLMVEDFIACHKCYFKLVRENRELERKLKVFTNFEVVKKANCATAPYELRPGEGGPCYKGGAPDINQDAVVYQGASVKGISDGTASVSKGSSRPSGRTKRRV